MTQYAEPRRGAQRGRQKGEGTIRRRSDGRWEARYWATVDGVRVRRSICGRTRPEVVRQLREALTAKDRGQVAATGAGALADWLRTWVDGRTDLRPATRLRYRQIVELHIATRVGRTRLTALTPTAVTALYADLLAAGMTPAGVHHVHRVLRSALNQAVRLGQVGRNVAVLATVPRVPRLEMHTLTAEQVRTLLAASRPEDRVLYRLAVSTGMRLGELLALRWRDVDVDGGALQVVRTGTMLAGQGFVAGEPKTRRSRRRIDLSPTLVAALREHHRAQTAERLHAGSLWDDQDLVFCGPTGRPRQASNVSRNFHLLLARAGLPRVRFHDLRHTAASLMLLAGVNPKVVSEILGHSSVVITLDLYSHVLPTLQREAQLRMAELLG